MDLPEDSDSDDPRKRKQIEEELLRMKQTLALIKE
jgi:hypothetical protein